MRAVCVVSMSGDRKKVKMIGETDAEPHDGKGCTTGGWMQVFVEAVVADCGVVWYWVPPVQSISGVAANVECQQVPS